MKKYIYFSGAFLLLAVLVALIFNTRRPSPTSQTGSPKTYIALGDSVAAGVGLTDASDSSACDRTQQAYPDLIAKTLGYRLQNFACSGATFASGILGKQEVNKLLVASQIDQMFAADKPDLVSLTVGANDLDWTRLLSACYISSCGTAADTSAVQQKLNEVTGNLSTSLEAIKAHFANNEPAVIITGYYQVFPSQNTTCSDLSGIDNSELNWERNQQDNLNKSIQKTVAKFPFAKYIGVDFQGHELCSNDPWVQGVNDKQPYHPTAGGQTAIANQVVDALKHNQ